MLVVHVFFPSRSDPNSWTHHLGVKRTVCRYLINMHEYESAHILAESSQNAIKILHPVFTVCTTKTERTSVTLKSVVYVDIIYEKVKNIYILAL